MWLITTGVMRSTSLKWCSRFSRRPSGGKCLVRLSALLWWLAVFVTTWIIVELTIHFKSSKFQWLLHIRDVYLSSNLPPEHHHHLRSSIRHQQWNTITLTSVWWYSTVLEIRFFRIYHLKITVEWFESSKMQFYQLISLFTLGDSSTTFSSSYD